MLCTFTASQLALTGWPSNGPNPEMQTKALISTTLGTMQKPPRWCSWKSTPKIGLNSFFIGS